VRMLGRLPSGAYRVRVYGGVDPITGRRHDLRETVPPGPRAAREAEKVRTRLLAQVDERRNPRTSATVAQLLDRHLKESRLIVTDRIRRTRLDPPSRADSLREAPPSSARASNPPPE
jgi:hypothetical protein